MKNVNVEDFIVNETNESEDFNAQLLRQTIPVIVMGLSAVVLILIAGSMLLR